MRILDSKMENGVINARLLIEYDDIIMAAGQQQAVQQAIVELSGSLGVTDVHFASVTEMTEQDNGDIEICLEAAISPEVILGQYKGLEIKIGHNENFEEAVLNAAAANIKADIPELIIERQLDAIENEAHAQVLESTSLHTLADIRSIVEKLNRQAKNKVGEEEVWKIALAASESYIAKNVQDVDEMVAAIKEQFDSPEETIFRAIVTRAQERAKLTAEAVAAQIFEAYLKSQNESLEAWREARYDTAVQRCRRELMLKAVVKAENISINDVELQRAAYELACGYGMDVGEFLSIVGEDGIRAQLCQQKAVELIVESAKGL